MLEKLSKATMWLVIAAVVAILGVCSIGPKAAGLVPFSVLSRSMTGPEGFCAGDLVVVKPLDGQTEQEALAPGTIVSYFPQPDSLEGLTTHRIQSVEITAGEGPKYITKGDANQSADEPILARQVAATHVYTVPLMGWVAISLDGDQRKLLTYALAASLFAYAGYSIIRAIWPSRHREDNAETPQNKETENAEVN